MAVGMPDVTFTNTPWFVSGRHGCDQALVQSELIRRINLCRRRHPPTHPHPTSVIVPSVPRHRAAARSLAVLAKEDFAITTAHAAKGRRVAPIPAFLPAKLLEPGKALFNIGNVKNGSKAMHLHRLLIPPYRSSSGSRYASRAGFK